MDAYAYDITRARITWTLDGIVSEDAGGAQSVTLRAPALGTPLTITVRVTEAGGSVHTARRTVTPSALDLVVEGDTRVPYFYRGRALPSAGSAVRLIAYPTLYTEKGTLVSQKDIVYTWRIGESVAQSGIGRNVLTTTMPRSGSMVVDVTTETIDGSARFTTVQQIDAVEPRHLFYEDDPLYGLSQNALPPAFTLLNDEISVRAEPFFVSRDIFANASYDWTINGASTPNPNADPQTLTLRKTGSRGSTLVGFAIRNLTSLLQSASGTFTVYFE